MADVMTDELRRVLTFGGTFDCVPVEVQPGAWSGSGPDENYLAMIKYFKERGLEHASREGGFLSARLSVPQVLDLASKAFVYGISYNPLRRSVA